MLLAYDPFLSLAYPMIAHTPPVASNLPIKLWLLGNCQQIHTVYNVTVYIYTVHAQNNYPYRTTIHAIGVYQVYMYIRTSRRSINNNYQIWAATM